jgi:GH24 family phage-related lysozyme (muramidase)
MLNMDLGPHGLHLIQSYETFVPYVYDDLCPPVKGVYAEWQGEEVRGTLTIGWGHTDVAKYPLKCALGTRITRATGDEVLHVDMSECIADVNRYVKVHLTQGQFDALVSFRFNCGLGNLEKLIAPLNTGDYDGTCAKFGLYIKSKGQTERGLVRRRKAEQALWQDNYKPEKTAAKPVTPDQGAAKTPDPLPKPKLPAHVNPTVIAAGAGGIAEAANEINDTLSQVREASDALTSVKGMVAAMAADPMLWLALVVVIAIGVLWYHHNHTEG